MGKLNIQGGTPVGSASLCRTCSSAHIMIGFRESEQIIMCNDVHPNIVVPFAMHECTGYYDKNRPDWEQMEKLAITVVPGPLKPVGFKTGLVPLEKVLLEPDTREKDDDDDDGE